MKKILLISLCLMATTAFSAPRFGVKGGGVDFQLGSRAIMLEVKYNRGLTNMCGWWPSTPEYHLPDVKTQDVQLLAGIQLF